MGKGISEKIIAKECVTKKPVEWLMSKTDTFYSRNYQPLVGAGSQNCDLLHRPLWLLIRTVCAMFDREASFPSFLAAIQSSCACIYLQQSMPL